MLKFRRQWDNSPKRELPARSLESKTIPNQVKPLSVMVARLDVGNSFGITLRQMDYDYEVEHHDLTFDQPVIDIDQSDPLTSRLELNERLNRVRFLETEAQKAEKAAAEAAVLLQNPPTPAA